VQRVAGAGPGTTRSAAPRRSRRRRLIVTGSVAALAVVGAVWAGVSLLSRGGVPLPGATFEPEAPLLPGAPTVAAPPPAAPATVAGRGFDVSYPQCGRVLPTGAAFAIVGVNGGAPLTSNRCLRAQVDWARATGAYAVYLNSSWTGHGDPVSYGRRLVDDAVAREHAAGIDGTAVWWIDVETTNTWNGTTQENATVIASMAARLQELGVRVGIYSSPQQWQQIAGDWAPGLPVWNATGPGRQTLALRACSETFAGSATAIVQWVQKQGSRVFDHNLLCPAWKDRAGELLNLSHG
jgi:hypothetical protein